MLKNHICFVLDRSGSMETIRDAAIKAFNDQIDAITESSRGQITDVSLFTFSTIADEPTFFAAPLDSVKKLTRETFVPDGWTSLYAAILKATGSLMFLADANDPNTAFLLVVVSDGQNNISTHLAGDVAARLKTLQATNKWTILYLGCSSEDLQNVRELGISAGNSRGFEYSNAGVAGSSAMTCSATDSYFEARSAGATSVNNLYDITESKGGQFKLFTTKDNLSTKADDTDQKSIT